MKNKGIPYYNKRLCTVYMKYIRWKKVTMKKVIIIGASNRIGKELSKLFA
ncbi:hypothetical protein CLRAG_22420 [Clostridium ragsdalei P11]|uniref:Uncharacterized protein n=1 Tax=Clostridium ragsdalei P11 TaxID=1353534 RepID=A0A1A6ASD1_9CLOT|nr:hypothetical protein [Clostridium ragsdalei]OBR92948.1 hypothetical protein CLRAG_22420 [Clostridium ragsdalei P11]